MDKHWQQADQALASGEFAVAIAHYQSICERQPEYDNAWYFLGLAYLLHEGPEAAQMVWMERLDPLDVEGMEQQLTTLRDLLLAEGTRQLGHKRLMAAEQLFRQAIDLDDTAVAAFHGLGLAIVQQGQFESAIEVWQQAIALDPRHQACYLDWAQACEDIQDWQGASTAYQSFMSQWPDQADGYEGLGRCLLKQGGAAPALPLLQKAQAISPKNSATSGNLGWAYFLRGDVHGAISTWRQTLTLSSAYWRDIIQWHTSQQQPDQERTEQSFALNQALIQSLQQPDDSLCFKALGERFMALGWQEGARQCFDAIADKDNLAQALSADSSAASPPHPSPQTPQSPQPSGKALTLSGPIALCERTEEWATHHPEQCVYRPAFPPSPLPLPPPQSLEAMVHPSFRYGHEVPLPGSFVVEVDQGRYYTDGSTVVAAIAPDQTLLGDLSPFSPILSPGHPASHPSRHPLLHQNALPELQSFGGTVAVLAGLSDRVYFHWMLDLLPRIELLRRQGWTADTVDIFFVDTHTAFQKETLARLGIPLEKTRSPQDFPHIEALRLVIPSFPAAAAWMPQWACEFLRKTFPPTPQSPNVKKRRLFISRITAKTRRLINQVSVMEVLASLGFEAIELDDLSVQQQVDCFAQAEVVVGIHGSGLTNLVFSEPGTIVVELFSPFYVYPCYWLLANWQDLPYFYVRGSVPEGPFFHRIFYPDARCEDIWVDPNQILQTLDQAGIWGGD